MEQSFSMQIKMGMAQDGESDELKRVFLEGNPYLLVGFVPMHIHERVPCGLALLALYLDLSRWTLNSSLHFTVS